MPGFLERLQAKLELMRLERRYTRNRNRRSTFVSHAVYVDGDYVYQTPVSTGSSVESGASHRVNALHFDVSSPKPGAVENVPSVSHKKDKKKRFSVAMPGFGSDSPPRQSNNVATWR